MVTTVDFVDSLMGLAAEPGDASLDAGRILAEDFLGIAVAGSQTDAGRIIHEYALAAGAPGGSSVAGWNDRFEASLAALVTGTSGYSIGLTDTHARSITHPGPSVVPASLAVGQMVGASGRDFLTAVVVGCEAVVRIGAVVNPSHRARGFHPTATCNVFGAAVSAAFLLGLTRSQTVTALGLAGSMASGLYEFRHEGGMVMGLHGGWPARNGIIAAQLAARGFTGPSTILEGDEGFFRGFADTVRPELLRVDPTQPGILEVGLRPYNACRYGHSGIDALREIAAAHGPIDPDRIARVRVFTHKTAVEQESDPSTVIGARLSTKFTIAYAIAHEPKLSEVTQDDLTDPEVIALMDRMDVVEDAELTAIFPEKWACRVMLELTDGTTVHAQVDVPKGEPSNPMTEAEISDKFHRLVDPRLGLAVATQLESEFLGVVHAPSIVQLAEMLGAAFDPAPARSPVLT